MLLLSCETGTAARPTRCHSSSSGSRNLSLRRVYPARFVSRTRIGCEKGQVRQFVAMPLGQGYSVEEQITRTGQYGGLQLMSQRQPSRLWGRGAASPPTCATPWASARGEPCVSEAPPQLVDRDSVAALGAGCEVQPALTALSSCHGQPLLARCPRPAIATAALPAGRKRT